MAAGTSIFTLMGEIFIDNEKANESIQKTESRAEKLGEGLKKGIGTAVKWGAALGTAAIAGGTALFAMASKASETTDRIDKLSQKIGISRTAFQEYDYILSQNGTSVEVLQRGMKTLTDRMDESIQGTGKGAEAFGKLKVSATDLNGELKSQEVMFDEVAKKLMEMPPGAEKSALAFDLFGKAGQELMPLLNGTAENMDELRQKAHDMGLVLSDDAVDAGAKFQDSLDDVKRSLGAVATNIGTELMPMFQSFLDWIMDHMPEIQAVIKIVFEKIGEFVTVAIYIFKDHLLPIFVAIFEWTKENWPTIQAIIKAVFDGIKFVWDKVLAPTLTLLWDIFKNIVKWVSDNWPTIQSVFETVFNAIKFVWENILKPPLELLMDLFKALVNFVKDHFPGMQRTVETIFDGIGKAVGAVTKIFDGVVGAVKTAWDWLTKWNNEPVRDKTPEYGNTKSSGGGTRGYDGRHATGLDYVPFDGYRAILHKGEAVIPAAENKKTQTMDHTGTITVKGVNDKNETVAVVEMVLDQLRREVRLA